MIEGLQIRIPDGERDWKRFEELNFTTFFDSVPPYDAMDAKAFRKQHKELLRRYSPRDPEKGSLMIAASDAHDYLGHCWLGAQSDFFTSATLPWIFDLSVVPAYRSQGIGRFLMDDCAFRIRRMGYKQIGLQVMAHNLNAERFYARYGFTFKAHSMIAQL